MERLLCIPRHNLARARRYPATWKELACTAESSTRAARFGVLWALQYDRRPQDLPLLRFIFQQEIIHHRETSSPALALAAFLVAEHRRLDDIWMHWTARTMNLATTLNYHPFHLLTAGTAATRKAIRTSTHPDRARVLDVIDDPSYTDTAVDEWLTDQNQRFPVDPATESPTNWADNAAHLGDRAASRKFITEWAADHPDNEVVLTTLQFHLARLGYLTEAIEVQKESIRTHEPLWPGGLATKLLTLATLERRSGDHQAALQTLKSCRAAMLPTTPEHPIWHHYAKEQTLLTQATPATQP